MDPRVSPSPSIATGRRPVSFSASAAPAATPGAAPTAPPATPQPSESRGPEKCIALVYEGVNAVNKIRDVLGPTDPSKAPPGSIRKEFGSNIMVNAAHASDSEDNAKREIGIVKVGENNFKRVVEDIYGK